MDGSAESVRLAAEETQREMESGIAVGSWDWQRGWLQSQAKGIFG